MFGGGRPFVVGGADEVARVHAGLAAMGDVLRGPGAFGPEVPAPEGADAQARLLAFLGRRP